MKSIRAAFAAAFLFCVVLVSTTAQNAPAAPSPNAAALPEAKPATQRLADMYASAPASTRAAIKASTELAALGKWKSAFDGVSATDPDNRDPYILAAKIGLVLDGFIRTTMHRGFALKDFAAGESLVSLRAADGEFEMIEFDPAALAEAQSMAGIPVPPVLEKAIADYFFSVLNLFSGAWLAPDEEVGAMSLAGYARAREGGAYDAASLSNESELLIRSDRSDEAQPLLRESLALDSTAPSTHFNMAVSLLTRGEAAEALLEFDAAIKGFPIGDASEKLFGAYTLAARAAASMGDLARSFAYLDTAEKTFPEDPAPGLVRHFVAVESKDASAANSAADAIYARWPASPYVIRSVISTWIDAGDSAAAKAFLDRSLAKAGSNDEAAGAILFYSALLTAQGGPEGQTLEGLAEAFGLIAAAEERFKKVYSPDHEVFASIEGIRSDLSAALLQGAGAPVEGPPGSGVAVPDASAAQTAPATEGEPDATSAATE